MTSKIEHRGLRMLALLNLNAVANELGEQGTIDLVSELINGDALGQKRADEIMERLRG